MDIKAIDKNFNTSFTPPNDIEWFSIEETPFIIHGVAYCEEGLYRRLPKEIAEKTNEGVAHLSKNTAGGRVRFCTNSPYIVVRVEEPFEMPVSHMTVVGKCGVSLFVDNKFKGTIMPSYEQIVNADPTHGGNGNVIFDGIKNILEAENGAFQAEIFFPLYSAVRSMYIGLKKNSILRAPKAYKHTQPILFYGSSITQGGCAAKPGDDYVNRIVRMLDTDIINLGFSGSAKGEKIMAEYIASQNPSVFVLDYDHNAPNAEYLDTTHFALYETVRKAHPTTPIILMTMPTIAGYEHRQWNKARREVIFKSFTRAKGLGDKNVYLVDCYGCFGHQENGECGTVDDCHPDSLGFLRMAERIYPTLNLLLNGNK